MTSTIPPVTIKGLALEGCGNLLSAILGCVKALSESNKLNPITHFSSSSSSSMVSSLLACGASYDFLKKMFDQVNTTKFLDSDISSMPGFLSDFGWYNGDYIENLMKIALKVLTGNPNITFKELKDKYRKYLVITVVEVNKKVAKLHYLDYEEAPYVKIYQAVRIAMGVPFLFRSVRNGRGLPCIDGGTLDNYPIRRLYLKLKKEEVIGIKLLNSAERNIESTKNPESPSNLKEHALVIAEALQNQRFHTHIKKEDWVRTIKVNTGNTPSMDFEIKKETKDFLLKEGYEATKAFLSDHKPVDNPKINSKLYLMISRSKKDIYTLLGWSNNMNVEKTIIKLLEKKLVRDKEIGLCGPISNSNIDSTEFDHIYKRLNLKIFHVDLKKKIILKL